MAVRAETACSHDNLLRGTNGGWEFFFGGLFSFVSSLGFEPKHREVTLAVKAGLVLDIKRLTCLDCTNLQRN